MLLCFGFYLFDVIIELHAMDGKIFNEFSLKFESGCYLQ
jgi:hypothetical protein